MCWKVSWFFFRLSYLCSSPFFMTTEYILYNSLCPFAQPSFLFTSFLPIFQLSVFHIFYFQRVALLMEVVVCHPCWGKKNHYKDVNRKECTPELWQSEYVTLILLPSIWNYKNYYLDLDLKNVKLSRIFISN